MNAAAATDSMRPTSTGCCTDTAREREELQNTPKTPTLKKNLKDNNRLETDGNNFD
jgi:hypothetical protein